MDYAQWYEKISAPFRSAGARKAVNVLDRALVAIVAVTYVGALGVLAVSGDERLVRMVAVPAATFVLVTLARAAIDAPRPYELHSIDPIIHKDTRGKSMPSRHIASAVVIAWALVWLHPLWGVFALVACCIVAFTRIVGGVHFPRDVAAAVIVSTVCGLVGFFLIP